MKKTFLKKYLVPIIFLATVLIGLLSWRIALIFNKSPEIKPDVVFSEPVNQNSNNKESSLNSNISAPDNINTAPTNINQNLNIVPPKSVSSVLIKMSFLSQAPFANWDALHEDACEETSLIMVYHYYNKSSINSTQQGEDEIQKIIAYESSNGYGTSITLSELSTIAKKYYNMNSGRITTASKAAIIAELDDGKPVIVPAAGKLLDNPNFRNGGPNYHMLVIKGYDKNGFITNDPGTRKGEGFRYTYENLLNAIHDWDPGNIQNGAKNVLVFD